MLSKLILDHTERARFRFWARTIALGLGLLQVAARYDEISSADGVSYLDVADAYFMQDWTSAINTYWDPLYSWLLGGAIHILRPSAYWEFPVVNLVNFILFVFTLLSFEFFLQRVIQEHRRHIQETKTESFLIVPEPILLIAGYTMFFWASMHWMLVTSTTPDMLASALTFLAAGLLIGITEQSAKSRDFVLLGVVLGFGFLARANLLALGFIFFSAAFFAPRDWRKSLPRTLLGLGVFLLIASPFVIAMALQKGHLALGTKGKLSYAWYVNPGRNIIPDMHWQGGPPGFGHPKHPTRIIRSDVLFFEFATPVNGTYPPWYDPTYWNEGLTVRFDLKRQMYVFVQNLFFCWREFLAVLVFGYLLLIGVAGNTRASLNALVQRSWKLWVPAIPGLVIVFLLTDLFPMVLPEQPTTRLLAPYAILLFSGFVLSLRLKASPESRKLVLYTFGLAAMIVIVTLFYRGAHDCFVSLTRKPSIHWQVAGELRKMGIQPGDKIVIIGRESFHVYWARLAKVRIVAQTAQVEEFWSAERSKRDRALDLLRHSGADAFVSSPSRRMPDGDPDWQKIAETRYLMIR